MDCWKISENDYLHLMKVHRRWFHKNPEIGFRVENTQKYILEHLEKLKFDSVIKIAETGIKAVMDIDPKFQTLAFRADMDALTLDEATGLEFSSINEGIMHACGHDAHMAILLGFADWLSSNRSNLKKNVVLIFQPAEESDGGALPMINEGVLENPTVDAIFGFHLFPTIEQGNIGLKEGTLMARTSEFNVEFVGKTAHGAMPQEGCDALMAATHFIHSLPSAISRRINPMQNVLITFGKLQAGERRNIIAEKSMLEGIMRTFDDSVHEETKRTLLNLISAMESLYKVKGRYEEEAFYPAVYNDPIWTKKLKENLTDFEMIDAGPYMTAEDFSFFQKKIPGVFILLGTQNLQDGFCHPLHSNKFDFDEKIMEKGLQIYIQILTM